MQHDVAVACSALDLVVVPAQLLFYKALPLMGQSRIGCQTAVTPIFFRALLSIEWVPEYHRLIPIRAG